MGVQDDRLGQAESPCGAALLGDRLLADLPKLTNVLCVYVYMACVCVCSVCVFMWNVGCLYVHVCVVRVLCVVYVASVCVVCVVCAGWGGM